MTRRNKEKFGSDPDSCKICKALGSYIRIDIAVGQLTERFPKEIKLLEPPVERHYNSLARCPECGTFYYYSEEYDPHHFMGMGDATLKRLDQERTNKHLVKYGSSPTVDEWKEATGFDEWVKKVSEKTKKKTEAEKIDPSEVVSLATLYVNNRSWDELYDLLSLDDPVRSKVMVTIYQETVKFPMKLQQRFVELVSDPNDNVGFQSYYQLKLKMKGNKVTPFIGELIDLLDHKNEGVRGRAAHLIMYTFTPSQEKGTNNFSWFYGTSSARLSKKQVKEVHSRLDTIIKVFKKPKSAPKPMGLYNPPDPTTERAAEILTDALVRESDEIAREIWEKMFPEDTDFERWLEWRRNRKIL